jgi:hypothetical protein
MFFTLLMLIFVHCILGQQIWFDMKMKPKIFDLNLSIFFSDFRVLPK